MDSEYLNLDGLETQVDPPLAENPEDDDFVAETSDESSKMYGITWLSDSPFEETEINNALDQPSDAWGMPDDNWSASNNLNDNVEVEHSQNNMNGSEISFTGYGRCECGCGSFGGCGDICTYCGHPYSAHSRYKK